MCNTKRWITWNVTTISLFLLQKSVDSVSHFIAHLQHSPNQWYTAFVNAVKSVRMWFDWNVTHSEHIYCREWVSFPWWGAQLFLHNGDCFALFFHLASSEQEVLNQSGNSFQHSLLFIVQSSPLNIYQHFFASLK